MQRLRIERGPSTDQGTPGVATCGGRTWHSLELPWRDNRHRVSCILPGVFLARLIDGETVGRPQFGAVYELQDVPGRTGILMHRANWAGDVEKGWHSDLEGCLTIGESTGTLTPDVPGGRPQAAVERSGPAFEELFALTAGADIEVEIVWAPGSEPGSFDPPAEPVA